MPVNNKLPLYAKLRLVRISQKDNKSNILCLERRTKRPGRLTLGGPLR
jgi:hypothetical protein